MLLANSHGSYLGETGQDELFAELNTRDAVAFIHPAELPGPQIPGVPPFAADFLLDTTRAAYLLARNGILTRYPRITFILSHAGGFLPYAAQRIAIAADTGRTPLDVLDRDADCGVVDVRLVVRGSPSSTRWWSMLEPLGPARRGCTPGAGSRWS